MAKRRAMTLDELIDALKLMRRAHGGGTNVMAGFQWEDRREPVTMVHWSHTTQQLHVVGEEP